MNNYLIYFLGFFAQILFFIRTIAQWFKSEKEGEVISPVIYWQLSLLGSILMLTYGILRNDFAIVLGQFIVYFIYIRNLQLKNAWKKMLHITRILAVTLPVFCLLWLIFGNTHNLKTILKNEDVALWLMIWGSAGQVIFTMRFFYQWIYSENRKDSLLPLGFWVISTIGSLMIFTYSIYRLDPVLFAAHSLGLFIYARNILLYYGKRSLFSKMNRISFLNKLITKVSDKIK
jgi:lipid-A-disaccharide synthase-like uncharacterized protein